VKTVPALFAKLIQFCFKIDARNRRRQTDDFVFELLKFLKFLGYLGTRYEVSYAPGKLVDLAGDLLEGIFARTAISPAGAQ
jgi:hypothetical protein